MNIANKTRDQQTTWWGQKSSPAINSSSRRLCSPPVHEEWHFGISKSGGLVVGRDASQVNVYSQFIWLVYLIINCLTMQRSLPARQWLCCLLIKLLMVEWVTGWLGDRLSETQWHGPMELMKHVLYLLFMTIVYFSTCLSSNLSDGCMYRCIKSNSWCYRYKIQNAICRDKDSFSLIVVTQCYTRCVGNVE